MSGQIATFLLLVMVAVLIFAIVTVNIGNLTANATTVANAADSSALLLGSQLATRANTLCMSLGDGKQCLTERCKRTGLLALVLAIIVAVIVTIATWGTLTGPTLMMLKAMLIVAGFAAAAGALGGAIAGTGVISGALQGAMVGAAIAGGIAGGAKLLGQLFGQTIVAGTLESAGVATEVTVTSTETVAVGTTLAAGTEIVTGSVFVPSVTAGIVGGVLGGAVVAGSSLFSESVKQQIGFAEAAKALSGLPQRQSLRESAFQQALSQVVDDPNKTTGQCFWPEPFAVTGDPHDANGNGDTTEAISCFQFWLDRRTAAIRRKAQGETASIAGRISRFFSDATPAFREKAQTFIEALARQEVEEEDGPVVALPRALYGTPYRLSFWEPGPTKADIQQQDCDTCTIARLPGYDSMDDARDELTDAMQTIEELEHTDVVTRFANRDSWAPWFYDPDAQSKQNEQGELVSPGDLYRRLGVLLEGDASTTPPLRGLPAWQQEIEQTRDRLPPAQLAYLNGAVVIENPPAQLNAARKARLAAAIQVIRQWLTTTEEHVRNDIVHDLTNQGYTQVQNITLTDLTLALHDGGIIYHYAYTFEYLDLTVEPPEVKTGQGQGDGSSPVEAPDLGLRVPSSPLPAFTSAVEALGAFVDQVAAAPPFATVDADTEDEFRPVLQSIGEATEAVRQFRADIQQDLAGITGDAPGEAENTLELGGIPLSRGNPVTYRWKDSRGVHSVTVKVNKFLVPRVDKVKHGNWLIGKTCLVLVNHRSHASVTVTRQDPANQTMGFWKWNPFSGEVTKKCRVHYTEQNVKINRTW